MGPGQTSDQSPPQFSACLNRALPTAGTLFQILGMHQRPDGSCPWGRTLHHRPDGSCPRGSSQVVEADVGKRSRDEIGSMRTRGTRAEGRLLVPLEGNAGSLHRGAGGRFQNSPEPSCAAQPWWCSAAAGFSAPSVMWSRESAGLGSAL